MIATNTHILVQEFDYLEPTSLPEAAALLDEHGENARLMAGGTDLLVQCKMERRQPSFVISLAKIPGLAGIRENGGGVDIGATTTIRALYKSPLIRKRYQALAEACNWFSTIQIMNMSTLGGNLCNASPAADTAPPLLCFEAQVTLFSPSGERTLPLDEFFLGPGKTALQPGEILTRVRLPAPAEHSGSAFCKVARVVADISKVCAAVKLVRDGDRISDCRIALGSVAPTPVRAQRAEAALAGQAFDEKLAARAAEQAASEISPIGDVRSTREYRQEVAAVIVRDAIELAWERAGT